MKWLGKMFASDTVVEKGFNLIDKAFYTGQEKASDQQRAIDKKDELLINWLEASKGANIARRFMAFLVAGVWAFLFMFSWGAEQLFIWSDGYNKEKLELMSLANEKYLDQATGAMMLVLGFYFAAPFMGDIAKGAMARFGGRNKEKDSSSNT